MVGLELAEQRRTAAQERFAEAEQAYKAIPGWEGILSVRTALADLLRYRGDWSSATAAYHSLLDEWPAEIRPWAGLAEVLKRKGDLPESLAIYEKVLATGTSDERDEMIYRLAKCNVLKQQFRLEDALDIDLSGLVSDFGTVNAQTSSSGDRNITFVVELGVGAGEVGEYFYDKVGAGTDLDGAAECGDLAAHAADQITTFDVEDLVGGDDQACRGTTGTLTLNNDRSLTPHSRVHRRDSEHRGQTTKHTKRLDGIDLPPRPLPLIISVLRPTVAWAL